ncbi:MAG: hypothetical protein QOD06_287 [Candidatus Binatota bacterium]|nr:hypothetical protein [Candidatus Binatota bacterium]
MPAAPPAAISIDASLSFGEPHARGSMRIRWRNPGPEPTDHVRLLLFANRFAGELEGFDDLARHTLIAGGSYRHGGTVVSTVRAGGRELATHLEAAAGATPPSVLTVELPRRLPVGREIDLAVEFATTLPSLLDAFGASDDLLVANGGWYPVPLEPGEDLVTAAATVRAALHAPEGAELLVNGRVFAGSTGAAIEAPPGHAASIVLSRSAFEVERVRIGKRVVALYGVPSREIPHRVSPNPTRSEALLETLPEVVAGSRETSELVLARVPLRWIPTRAASGMVLVSDRLFDLHPLVRFVHRRELAYAVYLLEELDRARRREPACDVRWVAEGLAWRRAEELYAQEFRPRREVGDWIRMLNVFAVVDRFETAPRIPLLRPFFPVLRRDDALGLDPDEGLRDRPPGRLTFTKLEERLRPESWRAVLDRYARGSAPLREVIESVAGAEARRFTDEWVRRYPAIDYALDDVENDAGGVHVRVRREGRDLPAVDSLEVGIETGAGDRRHFVDLDGSAAEATLPGGEDVGRVRLDPDRRVVQTRLDDDVEPPELQFLLDSADVEVSSTEFGFSTLFVARRRYDYVKDLAAAPFITNRGYGVDAGFQLHGGTPIDANLYRHNLFAYYALQELDSSFEDREEPEIRTGGRLGGIGFRYNYYDAFWFENPTRSHHLRAFFDFYDGAVGSDYDYVQGGASLAVTRPLRADTVIAAELVNGFSASTSGGVVPLQGLFSLGGFRSIRGIGAEERLAENILVGRGEVRWMTPLRLDLNFLDVLIARRLQLRAFADAGRVADPMADVYDVSAFAAGAGGGMDLFYDFLGFFPTSFYLDLATRVDRRDSLQVLFGARQPF